MSITELMRTCFLDIDKDLLLSPELAVSNMGAMGSVGCASKRGAPADYCILERVHAYSVENEPQTL